jgi:hypothetical protein
MRIARARSTQRDQLPQWRLACRSALEGLRRQRLPADPLRRAAPEPRRGLLSQWLRLLPKDLFHPEHLGSRSCQLLLGTLWLLFPLGLRLRPGLPAALENRSPRFHPGDPWLRLYRLLRWRPPHQRCQWFPFRLVNPLLRSTPWLLLRLQCPWPQSVQRHRFRPELPASLQHHAHQARPAIRWRPQLRCCRECQRRLECLLVPGDRKHQPRPWLLLPRVYLGSQSRR